MTKTLTFNQWELLALTTALERLKEETDIEPISTQALLDKLNKE